MIKNCSILLFILLLPACTFHKYKKPYHPLPEQFALHGASINELDDISNWWKHFNDPVLDKLIEIALEQNYNLQIAAERIEEARAFYHIKRAELFPQVDVTGEVRRTKFSEKVQQFFTLGGQKASFFQFGADAFWEIDFWGKIWHEKRARFYQFQSQIEAMRDIYIILIADVARAYIQLCSLYKQIRLLHENVRIETELVRLQKDLFYSGLSSKIAVTIAQQVLATTLDTAKALTTDMIQTKNQLAVLLGMNPEDVQLKKINNDIPVFDEIIQTGLPSDLLRRRPDIRQTERLLAASNELVSQAIAEWFPSFTLLGSVFTEASKSSDWFGNGSLSWSIGPTLRWPLLNFGRIRAQINTRKSAERQAALQYSQTIIAALQDVEDFLIAYFNTHQQVTIIEQKRNATFEQEQLVTATFESGLQSKLNALEAIRNRISTEIELTISKERMSNSIIGLYKALGGGW